MSEVKKPRVLIVIERFYPLVGGAEIQCLQIGERLKMKGYRIEIVTKRWRKEFSQKEILEGGLPINRVGFLGFNRMADYLSGLALFVFLLKNRNNFDLLFIDSGIANIFASTAIIVGKILGKRIVAKFETPGELTFSGDEALSSKKFVHPLIRFRLSVAKKADYYLAQTEGMRNELVDFGIENQKIKSFPNSIDENIFCPPASEKDKEELKKQLNLPDDKKLVFFCGRLVKRKGLIFLLNLWVIFSKKNSSAVLVLIGSGKNQPDSVEEELLKIAENPSLKDKIIFLGEKNREEVADYLKTADVFVYPSIHPEGRAVSVLEAMSTEVPVVVTDIGGLREIVTDGFSGYLVEVDDTKTFSFLLEKLIKNQKLRASLGKEGRREVIKNYSLEKSAEDINNYFCLICK